MPIRILAPDVISKIAAGEVVERPASVVKELVENSLDARATRISVEIAGGGRELIRVSDNGTGILADEVALSFERHATGKITSEADLEIVSTLGFRGEALPSIASVSDMSMLTCHADEDAGTFIRLEAGRVAEKKRQGCPQGTTIAVRNLFANVPARLKFLKSAGTENSHISHLVTQYALAYPEVRFELTISGRSLLKSPGSGDLRDALLSAYDLATAKAMMEIPPDAIEPDGISPLVAGLVGPGEVSRSNRRFLTLLVNRRWIQNRTLSYAVEEAYKGMLMTGKHPVAVINISIPPGQIDVNVHPAKTEIKFQNEREVFTAVQRAVRNALVGAAPVPEMRVSTAFAVMPPKSTVQTELPSGDMARFPLMTRDQETAELPGDEADLPILRVIGQLHNAYIIAEGPDGGMYLIDQHAAHERILFEKVSQQQMARQMDVQGLLEPLSIDVTASQGDLLKLNGHVLEENGFSLEPFGERCYLLRTVPAVIKPENIVTVVNEIIDKLGEPSASDWSREVAASVACHGAIRAGQKLEVLEMAELLRQLEETSSPRTCPHGRPTVLHLSGGQIEKSFGR